MLISLQSVMAGVYHEHDQIKSLTADERNAQRKLITINWTLHYSLTANSLYRSMF